MTQLRARLDAVEIPRRVPGFTIRRYEPGDEAAILEGFNQVFAQGNPSFQPRGLVRWRWQFADNPVGTQVVVALHNETGALAGHYAGIPREFDGFGRQGRVAEAVDSFVDPRFRAALRRPGLFVVMALYWFREFCGSGEDFFAYGLPIETAARIGGAFLNYQIVHQQLALEKPVSFDRTFGGPSMPSVERIVKLDNRFDELWHRIGPLHGAAVDRNSNYLRWRYLLHPEHEYCIGAAGDDTELRGFVVSRKGWFDGRESMLLIDWAVEPGDLDTGRALLRFAAERARVEGAASIRIVLPPSSRWFLDFQRLGFFARPTGYNWSVSHNRRPFDTHRLRRQWWYTLGDTDLA